MVFNNFIVNNKGQLSVEFILIILVILILIETIILPLRNYSQNSLEDISSITYLENAKDKIFNAINDANIYSEAKLKVNFYIPEDANMFLLNYGINDSNIVYVYMIKSDDINYPKCNLISCYNQFKIGVNVLRQESVADSAKGYLLMGPNNYELIIDKNSSGIYITK